MVMKYNSILHTKVFLIKGILGKLESLISNISKNRNDIIVLNYHGVQKKFIESFEWQVNFLLQNFDPITPAEFEDLIESSEDLKYSKPKFLLTFDDGIRNNLNAISILNKYSLKAYFFIVPQFVDSEDPKEFFLNNIRPIINSNIDSNLEDFTPLVWSELKTLSENGHYIGAHTNTHAMTKNFRDEQLDFEIINSKQTLESMLDLEINAFCSINNTLESVNARAAKKIKENYKLHFTTVAGKNIPLNKHSIKRVNVESNWTDSAFKYALGNWDQKRWKQKINEVDNLMK